MVEERGICTGPTGVNIVAVARAQLIVARPAFQGVVAIAAAQPVIADTTLQQIIAVAAEHHVSAVKPKHRVVVAERMEEITVHCGVQHLTQKVTPPISSPVMIAPRPSSIQVHGHCIHAGRTRSARCTR